METLRQFSLFLANKHSSMTQIFRELAKAKINVTGMALMDSMEHGVLRMITSDADGARSVFRDLNVQTTETDVLAVALPNRPGALAEVCEKLSAAHVNVGYLYCTTGSRGGKATIFLKIPNIAKAVKVLGNSKTTRRDMKVKLRRPAATKRR